MVVLPEHLHCIWSLGEADANYSLRWKFIKEGFTKKYLVEGGRENNRSDSKRRRGERAVWQRRFWEHTVRNEDELGRLCDYIHYNPVKHGHVKCPHQWPHSSFHRFVRQDLYPSNWACCCVRDPEVPAWLESLDNVGE